MPEPVSSAETERFEDNVETVAEGIVSGVVGRVAGVAIGFAVGGPVGAVIGGFTTIAVGALTKAAIDTYQSVPNNPGGYRRTDDDGNDADVNVDFWGRPNSQGETWRVEGVEINYNYRTCDLDFTGTGQGERIQGCRNSDDVIRGNGGADLLFGNAGADKVDGGTGNDKLWGEGGNDRLEGAEGDNTVRGGQGRDVILVRNSRSNGDLDSVEGGQDTDAFHFYRGSAARLKDYRMGEDLVWRDGSVRASDINVEVAVTAFGSDLYLTSARMTSSRGTVVEIDPEQPIFVNHHADRTLENAQQAARAALVEHFDFA